MEHYEPINAKTEAEEAREREDFWLEIGPRSAYRGLDCYERAVREGDASPDGERLGFEGAEKDDRAQSALSAMPALPVPPDEAWPLPPVVDLAQQPDIKDEKPS